MRTTPIATTLFTLAVMCTSYASAQQINIKPGLWQLDVTMPGQMGGSAMANHMAQMKAQMASVPPEQRKAMEKAMAGIEARGMEFTGDGMRMKQCITKENIAGFDLLGKKTAESCTKKTSTTIGGAKLSMTCTRPPMKMEAALKYQGEKAYTFESLTTVTGPDGNPVTQKSSGSGKWLGSDCGKIQPDSMD